jgi:hypothetical protein
MDKQLADDLISYLGKFNDTTSLITRIAQESGQLQCTTRELHKFPNGIVMHVVAMRYNRFWVTKFILMHHFYEMFEGEDKLTDAFKAAWRNGYTLSVDEATAFFNNEEYDLDSTFYQPRMALQ